MLKGKTRVSSKFIFSIIRCVAAISLAAFVALGVYADELGGSDEIVLSEWKEVADRQLAYKATYDFGEKSDGIIYFTNYVDGYSLAVPPGLLVDMSDSSVRAVLERMDLRIEIYKQPCDSLTGISKDIYIKYFNSWIYRDPYYEITFDGTKEWDNKSAAALAWQRDPLLAIPIDRRYYVALNMLFPNHDYIYTILIKCSWPLSEEGLADEYMSLAEGFKLIAPAAPAYTITRGGEPRTDMDAETTVFFRDYFLNKGQMLWGLFHPDAPSSFAGFRGVEEEVGFKFPLALCYTGIVEGEEVHPRLGEALNNARREGKIPELTLQTVPEGKRKSGNMLYDILNGEYDVYIRDYARKAADFGAPVLFRPGNEMNGDWCNYSAVYTSMDPEIFKAFYRYLFNIFKEEGADNVLWIWNPNSRSFPDFRWNEGICYYPGDEYVDIIGLTAYNTGTYYKDETWQSFVQLYDEVYYKVAAEFKQPLMITEFASSSIGGDKVAWVKEMFEIIGYYDRIRAAVWWNSSDLDAEGMIARPYYLNETEELVQVFRQELSETMMRNAYEAMLYRE
ncbi:MAG: glycoside hydrolase family 26 protein [Clostridiales Family XIII bacterium]|jgi:hypothetical protein|nr:glycoside hydrolase family 26 protein [Clostridiales Family XIII bacterium]